MTISNPTDTNQASEIDSIIEVALSRIIVAFGVNDKSMIPIIKQEAKTAIQALIRTEKLKLLAELDKSMPTAEQLTTRYGYHMPEKQYGYRLALHDIREVLAKLEAEL